MLCRITREDELSAAGSLLRLGALTKKAPLVAKYIHVFKFKETARLLRQLPHQTQLTRPVTTMCCDVGYEWIVRQCDRTRLRSPTQAIYFLIYLFIYCWRIARSPQGFSQVQISHTSWTQYKTCTLHKRQTYKHNPQVSPFGIALVKKEKKGK